MALFNATKKGSAIYFSSIRTTTWYLVIAKSYLIPGKKRCQSQLKFISLLYSFYVAGMKILNMIFLLNTSKQGRMEKPESGIRNSELEPEPETETEPESEPDLH